VATSRGYTATKDQLLGRLARAEGQVRGITTMVEEDRYCLDVLTQISAAQAALDKIALGLLDDHTRHCVLAGEGGAPADSEARADEIMAAVGRLVRRRGNPPRSRRSAREGPAAPASSAQRGRDTP